MKASELIKELEKAIEERGDLEVDFIASGALRDLCEIEITKESVEIVLY